MTAVQGENNCRRHVVERRRPHLRAFYYACFKTRRRGERRDILQQVQHYYSDHYDLNSATAALTMMLLCIVDSVLTLMLLERGASELNPMAALLLNHGSLWFFTVKYLLTALCVFTLVMHTRIGVFGMRGYHLLQLSILFYLLLVNYQVVLLLY